MFHVTITVEIDGQTKAKAINGGVQSAQRRSRPK